jgi:hypothetical protein
MPASTIVSSGGAFRLYGDAVQTYEKLPVATYAIAFSELSGYTLHRVEPLTSRKEAIYGNHAERVRRIASGYSAMNRSLGVILSGNKGMGKSLMVRMIAERMRDERGLPTVLVQRATPGLASFLDELGETVVVLDEFEKVFPNEGENEAQNQFLSLFDGLSTTKRLYVLSVNELRRVNDYMLNRPGRFHYHLRFAYPDAEAVAQYLRDQVPGIDETQVATVVDFSRRYDVNFDHLRAIAFELSLGEVFGDVIGDLNIKRSETFTPYVEAHITWDDGETDAISGQVDLFDRDGLQSIDAWELEISLQFRVRDAVPSKDGYLLPCGAFETVDTRDQEDRQNDEKPRAAVSVVLRRTRQQSIDF